MRPSNRKSFTEMVKDIFWFWPFFLLAAILLVIFSVFFFDDINLKLDKKMTCTVSETEVVSGTYSIGNSNGSYTSVVVESEECPELIFTDLPEGIQGTNDLQRRLEPGHKYTFVYGYIKIPWDTTKAYSFTEQ